MKKLITFGIILVLLSGAVSAEFKEIHDDWHAYKDSWTSSGEAFSVIVDPNNDNKILFKHDQFSWIISVEQCVANGNFQYCYENFSYEEPESTISDDGKWVPALHIIINEEDTESADFDVKHSFDMVENGDHTLTITFENNEDKWINPINYEIVVPDGVRATSYGGFTKVGNTLKLVTSLNVGGKKTYIVRFETAGFQTYDFDYEYSYESNTVTKEGSGTAKAVVDGPYKITTTFEPKKLDILSSSLLDIEIDNNRLQDALTIKELRIVGPVTKLEYSPKENLKLAKIGEFTSTTDSVNEDSTKDFKLNIKPQRTGEYEIKGFFVLEVEGVTFEENFTKTLEATAEGIETKFYVNKDDLLAGSDTTLVYAIGNNNDLLDFYNIEVDISSDFFNHKIELPELLANTNLDTIFTKEIKVPVVASDETFVMTAKTKYDTEVGETIEKEDSFEIDVTGTGEILSVRRVVQKDKIVNPGDEITVEVFVKNLKTELFQQITSLEEFTRGGEVSFGKTFETFSIQPNEEKKAYTYKIKLQDPYFWDTFNLTTNAVISNIGYKKTESTTVNINKSLPVVDDIKVDGNDDVVIDVSDTGQGESEKKPSFFVKVFTAIEDFFVGLFK